MLLQYELKELKRRQEDDERQRAEELAAQQAALAALHSPPEGSHHDQYVKSTHFVASSILIFLFVFCFLELMETRRHPSLYLAVPIRIPQQKPPKVKSCLIFSMHMSSVIVTAFTQIQFGIFFLFSLILLPRKNL